MQKNNNFLYAEITPSVRPSYDETLEQVKVQIDYDCFPFGLIPIANEIAMIIADVFRMRPTDRIKVDDNLRSVTDVQSVYLNLEHEHIVSVIEKFDEIPYRVKRPRLYLRSMLYAEVFEHESAGVNLFNSTTGDGV